jgi:hypothetical protein
MLFVLSSALQIIYQKQVQNTLIVYIILDALIGDTKVLNNNHNKQYNITIENCHLGVNLVFTSQNPCSIPNTMRSNIDVYVLYWFANGK